MQQVNGRRLHDRRILGALRTTTHLQALGMLQARSASKARAARLTALFRELMCWRGGGKGTTVFDQDQIGRAVT